MSTNTTNTGYNPMDVLNNIYTGTSDFLGDIWGQAGVKAKPESWNVGGMEFADVSHLDPFELEGATYNPAVKAQEGTGIAGAWSDMSGKDQFGLVAGLGMAGLQGYNAYQANETAQDKLDFQMDAFNKNFGMQQTAYNDNIEAKNRTLASATGSNEYAHDYVGDRKNQNIA